MTTDDKLSEMLAVLASQMGDVREDIKDFRKELQDYASKSVTRSEWEQRNTYSDNRFHNLGKEIADLRTELRSKATPWYSVAAVVLSGGALAWAIVGPAVTGGN